MVPASASLLPRVPPPLALPQTAASFTNFTLVFQYFLKVLIEGSLEAKLPTIRTDGKVQPGGSRARKKLGRGESQKKKKKKKKKTKKKIRDGESQKREDAGAQKGREVAKHCVFPVFCGSGGSKSRLAKAAGAEASGQMRHEKLRAIVARSTF